MLVTKAISGNETSENTDQFWDHRSDLEKTDLDLHFQMFHFPKWLL